MSEQRDPQQLRQFFEGPMSDAESRFLTDLTAFVDYAKRNGLSFPMVISTLAHDINRVAQVGFSLREAVREGFLPKTSGYADLREDSVGQSEEASDAA